MEPPLKWAGGKRWQLPWLQPIWDTLGAGAGRRLVEPFCGGLGVALGLEPERALLNDANPHVVNFYKQIQAGLEWDLELDPESYYANRDWFNTLIRDGQGDTPMAAQLFYYLNRVGFNGLCRFSKDGTFNVPVGTARTVPPLDVQALQPMLRRWMFTVGDFGQVALDPEDFVYADPPYDAGFTAYTAGQFTWDDQERIAMLLAGHPGPVLLTNRATDRILELYRSLGLHTVCMEAPRRVGGDRAAVLEVVAANFPIDRNGMITVPSA